MSNANTEPQRPEQATWDDLAGVLGFTPQTLRGWRQQYPTAPKTRSVVEWCDFIVGEGLGDSHYLNGKLGAADVARDMLKGWDLILQARRSHIALDPAAEGRFALAYEKLTDGFYALYDDLDNLRPPPM